MVNYTFLIIISLIGIIVLMANYQPVDNGIKNSVLTIQDKITGQFNKHTDTSSCPDTYQPVCGGTVTYKNLCFATEAGVNLVTEGVCI